MNLITRLLAGPGQGPAPGPGPVWGHQHHGFDVDPSPFYGGSCSRFFYTFCSSIATCAYFICCCWMIQDCVGNLRDYDSGPPRPPPPFPPRPSSPGGLWAPPVPPQPPLDMPRPPAYPAPPGPPVGPIESPFY